MAEQRTDKSRYPSKYSPGGWVTGAQYIIELVCEQRARFLNKDLPVQFWKLKEWQKYFVSQTRATHKLLKKYEAQAIINAVKAKRLRTLMPKWIDSVVAQEQEKLDAKRRQKEAEKHKRVEQKQSIIDVPQRRTRNIGTSALDKLLALDEEIEHGEEET